MSRIAVENVNHPGSVRQVDAAPYEAMKSAYLAVLSSAPQGLTIEEIGARLGTHLPQEIFPGGAKAGWWAKTVQLDLEAKGIIRRRNTRPLRLAKA